MTEPATKTAWSPHPFVTRPLGMLLPNENANENENEREAYQVPGITAQNEEIVTVGGIVRAREPDGDEIATDEIH